MILDQTFIRQADGSSQLTPAYLAESRAPQMIAGNVATQVLGTFFFLCRAYSRLFIVGSWKSEDYLLSIAWISCTAYSICQYGQIAHGAGRHIQAATSQEDGVISQQYAFAAQIILFPALACSKIGICLSYLRIFYSDKRGRYFIQALIVFLVLSILPFAIEVIFQCRPIHVYWTEFRPTSKCLQDIPALYTNGSMNVVADIALIIIVLPRILNLQLNQRQKTALVGIVLLGLLAVVAGILRMVKVGRILRPGTFDTPWAAYDISIWTSTEMYISLICASAPGVKPLLSRLIPKLLGTSLRSRSRNTGQTPGSVELSSKFRRTTLTSGNKNSLHKSVSMTGLTKANERYAEVGRGADEVSLDEQSDKSAAGENGIIKRSEITVSTHAID